MSQTKLSKQKIVLTQGDRFAFTLVGVMIFTTIVISGFAVIFVFPGATIETYTNCTVENVTSEVSVDKRNAGGGYNYTTSCGNFIEYEKASMGVGYTYNIEAFKASKEVHEVELLSNLK